MSKFISNMSSSFLAIFLIISILLISHIHTSTATGKAECIGSADSHPEVTTAPCGCPPSREEAGKPSGGHKCGSQCRPEYGCEVGNLPWWMRPRPNMHLPPSMFQQYCYNYITGRIELCPFGQVPPAYLKANQPGCLQSCTCL